MTNFVAVKNLSRRTRANFNGICIYSRSQFHGAGGGFRGTGAAWAGGGAGGWSFTTVRCGGAERGCAGGGNSTGDVRIAGRGILWGGNTAAVRGAGTRAACGVAGCWLVGFAAN